MAVLVKTIQGLAWASVKTRNGLAVASMKSLNGLDTTSSGTCTELFAMQSFGSNEGGVFTSVAQHIKNSSSDPICRTKIVLAGTGNAIVELWSGLGTLGAGGGTQYGAASIAEAVGGMDEIIFEWASNPTAPGDYYIIAKPDVGGTLTGYQTTGTPDSYAPGEGYGGYVNGSTVGGSGQNDIRFDLWTMQ